MLDDIMGIYIYIERERVIIINFVQNALCIYHITIYHGDIMEKLWEKM